MKLQVKFLLFSVVCGLVLMAVSLIGYLYSEQQVSKNIESEMTNVVSAEVNQMDGWVMSKARTAEAVGWAISKGLSDQEITTALLSGYKEDKEISALYVGLENGKFLTGSGQKVQANFDPRQRDWYKKAKEQNSLAFTDVYINATTGQSVVSAAAPIKNHDGSLRGIIGLSIPIDTLYQKVKEINLHGHGYGLFMDQNGTILTHPTNTDLIGKKLSEVDMYKQISDSVTKQPAGTVHYKENGDQYIMIFNCIPSTKWILAIAVPEKEAYEGLVSFKYQYMIIVLIGIMAILGIGFYFSRNLAKKMIILTESAAKIANGDLTQKEISVHSQDEVGQLAKTFYSMQGSLHNLICQMSQTSEQLASSSEQISGSIDQMNQVTTHIASSVTDVASGASEQAAVTNDTAAVVERMSAGIQQVAANTNQLALHSGQVADKAQNGGQAVTEAVTQMENIENTVNTSAKVVAELGERSKEIGQIVDTISNIAGQTNLLALNAAIEAARAGEQGRGFAVVADEVRNLAEQSHEAAKRIATLIGEIQGDTDRAVVAMSDGTREVKTGTEVVNTVGATFREITELVTQVSDQVKEISAALQQLATGSQQIVDSVKKVDELSKQSTDRSQSVLAATEEQLSSMEEVATSSRALATLANKLQAMVDKFQI
ncbi:methyl-accepting chemotaxis protein [Sporomusa acidovorans]|uniref:Methyl-accepting chemotaxis protein McpB n=1 Tax=Sporomusa acidovorans (strain ATCC 49682 / DSM 3132 / Mol) TaxID=1123286 RepID=A0ABZ3J6K3_SPOA4|nr:methyl-accepting chemotaxis protein [Sporomusa acidovorans]OZC21016.1 methyl-accepting chemotaxis protein McpB [Sporomusa acidovorans DSM 3132]SDF18340.1 methyl-accepting chemotaxis protein [Sporomusa acidovorans]